MSSLLLEWFRRSECVFAVLDLQFAINFVIQMLYICDIIYNEKEYEYDSG